MGYTTDFEGEFTFDKPLSKEHADYLRAFSYTRRMKRDSAKAELLPDPLRLAVNLPIGEDGAYYVGSHSDGQWGQTRDDSVIEYNDAPGTPKLDIENFNDSYAKQKQCREEGKCQPGLWCQWTVSEDNTKLIWNGGEKFYYYIEWLKYLIDHFVSNWGYKLNGEVKWIGEDSLNDTGMISVVDNVVTTKVGKVVYE